MLPKTQADLIASLGLQPTQQDPFAYKPQRPQSTIEPLPLGYRMPSKNPTIRKLQGLGNFAKSLFAVETPLDAVLSGIAPPAKVAKGVVGLAKNVVPNFKNVNKYDPLIEFTDPSPVNPFEPFIKTPSRFEKRIPIDDFLKLTTPSDEYIKSRKGSEYLSDLGKFDPTKATSSPIFLEVNKTGQVVGHEGRHRALLAQQAGAKTIPVQIKLERFDPVAKESPFSNIALDYYKKNKKIPKDLKDYGITSLKPQKFDNFPQRKNYNYNLESKQKGLL